MVVVVLVIVLHGVIITSVDGVGIDVIGDVEIVELDAGFFLVIPDFSNIVGLIRSYLGHTPRSYPEK